jgi:hypothetical protein
MDISRTVSDLAIATSNLNKAIDDLNKADAKLQTLISKFQELMGVFPKHDTTSLFIFERLCFLSSEDFVTHVEEKTRALVKYKQYVSEACTLSMALNMMQIESIVGKLVERQLVHKSSDIGCAQSNLKVAIENLNKTDAELQRIVRKAQEFKRTVDDDIFEGLKVFFKEDLSKAIKEKKSAIDIYLRDIYEACTLSLKADRDAIKSIF